MAWTIRPGGVDVVPGALAAHDVVDLFALHGFALTVGEGEFVGAGAVFEAVGGGGGGSGRPMGVSGGVGMVRALEQLEQKSSGVGVVVVVWFRAEVLGEVAAPFFYFFFFLIRGVVSRVNASRHRVELSFCRDVVS